MDMHQPHAEQATTCADQQYYADENIGADSTSLHPDVRRCAMVADGGSCRINSIHFQQVTRQKRDKSDWRAVAGVLGCLVVPEGPAIAQYNAHRWLERPWCLTDGLGTR